LEEGKGELRIFLSEEEGVLELGFLREEEKRNEE
jgi:hypothetical protein